MKKSDLNHASFSLLFLLGIAGHVARILHDLQLFTEPFHIRLHHFEEPSSLGEHLMQKSDSLSKFASLYVFHTVSHEPRPLFRVSLLIQIIVVLVNLLEVIVCELLRGLWANGVYKVRGIEKFKRRAEKANFRHTFFQVNNEQQNNDLTYDFRFIQVVSRYLNGRLLKYGRKNDRSFPLGLSSIFLAVLFPGPPFLEPLEDLILLAGDLQLWGVLAAGDVPLELLQQPLPAELQVVAPQRVARLPLSLPVVVQALQLRDREALVLLDELHLLVLRHNIRLYRVGKLKPKVQLYRVLPVNSGGEVAAEIGLWMQDSAGSKRKVVLTDENYEAIFSLNLQSEPHTLEIQCKQLQSSSELWGSFKLSDLEPHYQAIFDRIDGLYHYISEKTEEVEIEDCCVKVMLNFLKQSKVIRLQLSEMVRCSADAQKKLLERVRQLETQNKALTGALKDQGNGHNYQVYQKLTLPLLAEAINFDSYKVTNFRELSPVPNNYLRSLLKLHPGVALPQSGLWSFQLTVTSFISDSCAKAAPQIQIGIKDNQSEAVVLTLNSNEGYSHGEDGREKAGESVLQENDYIRIILNMDARKLAVVSNFGESEPQFLDWLSLKGSKLWLSLRLYLVRIKTDLFVQQKAVDWCNDC